MEGASPRVETSRDKSTELTGGGEGSTLWDSQVTGFSSCRQPRPLTGGWQRLVPSSPLLAGQATQRIQGKGTTSDLLSRVHGALNT